METKMSEVVYSTIKEGETGKLTAVSVPYDPSMLDTEGDIALARAIHDDIQRKIQEWFDHGNAI
jgi:peptide methionine sulfoxide reductase MsrA